MDRAKKALVISVNHNRMAAVLLIGRQPMLWELVFKATETTAMIERQVGKWIDQFEPDFVVTEDLKTAVRKGERSKMILDITKRVVKRSGIPHRERLRLQPYTNRHGQIEDLCKQFPQLRCIAPKRRRHHDKEAAVITIFDAVAMATYEQ